MQRILVIEDNEDLRALLVEWLQMSGYEVVAAEDGIAAMAILKATPPALVITDLFMPNMDGIETIREVRERCPGVNIIAVSGGAEAMQNDYLKTALHVGAVKILRKPFELSELLDAVRGALGEAAA